jgi:hypothetical protein
VADVLGGQPASGEGVGHLHHRLVLAQVEGLDPTGSVAGSSGSTSAWTTGTPPFPLLDALIHYL